MVGEASGEVRGVVFRLQGTLLESHRAADSAADGLMLDTVRPGVAEAVGLLAERGIKVAARSALLSQSDMRKLLEQAGLGTFFPPRNIYGSDSKALAKKDTTETNSNTRVIDVPRLTGQFVPFLTNYWGVQTRELLVVSGVSEEIEDAMRVGAAALFLEDIGVHQNPENMVTAINRIVTA